MFWKKHISSTCWIKDSYVKRNFFQRPDDDDDVRRHEIFTATTGCHIDLSCCVVDCLLCCIGFCCWNMFSYMCVWLFCVVCMALHSVALIIWCCALVFSDVSGCGAHLDPTVAFRSTSTIVLSNVWEIIFIRNAISAAIFHRITAIIPVLGFFLF